MTDESSSAVRFAVKACTLKAAFAPSSVDTELAIANVPGAVVISEDQDRENWIEVRLILDWLDDDVFDALDPRDNNPIAVPPIAFRVEEYDAVGNTIRYWPGNLMGLDTNEAWLWPREISRDWVTRTVSFTMVSGEPLLADKMRISGSSLNTGATNVLELVNYSLADVFVSASLSSYPAVLTSTSLPVGDRRLMQPGQTHMDLIKSELDAIDCRIFDQYGRHWFADLRDATYGPAVSLATAPGLQSETDPIVWELVETRSRDGRYADGVLVKFDMTAYGGTVSWQASGLGVNTKGVMVTRQRPAPASNLADRLKVRTLIRGKDLDATARARLDIRTRSSAIIWTVDTYIEGTIRSVEYTLPDGIMRLAIQS